MGQLSINFLAICLSSVVVDAFLYNLEMGVVKEKNGYPTLFHHVEVLHPDDKGELSCLLPGADSYKWTLYAKVQAPYAASLKFDENADNSRPYIYTLDLRRWPSDLVVAVCEPFYDFKSLMRVVWVMTKLKTSSDRPYHPTACRPRNGARDCSRIRLDCYYGRGEHYQGTHHFTKKNKRCRLWSGFFPKEVRREEWRRLNAGLAKGEHNYCRNNVPAKHHMPYCYTMDSDNHIEYCNVRSCHECMFGNGNGHFPGIRGRFPVYQGRETRTEMVLSVKNQPKRLECFSGSHKGWQDNVCRHRVNVFGRKSVRARPHCLVLKSLKVTSSEIHSVWDRRLKLVNCLLPQCTVRQVWFLLINTNGVPYLEESNAKVVNIDVRNGQTNVHLKFGIFGMHRCSGLKIASVYSRQRGAVNQFKLRCHTPPQFSTLTINKITKDLEGVYQFIYQFEEADQRVEHKVYKAKFKIRVKETTSLQLVPPRLTLCPGKGGRIGTKVTGDHFIQPSDIEWMYSYNEKKWSKVISKPEMFTLSQNGMQLRVSRVTRKMKILVEAKIEGEIFKGTSSIKLKDLPWMKVDSPKTIKATIGQKITMTVQTKLGITVRWIHEAQEIKNPNTKDPSMVFSQKILSTGNRAHTLTITSVAAKHDGIYVIESSLEGCIRSGRIRVQVQK